MNKTISTLAAIALSFGALQSSVKAGDFYCAPQASQCDTGCFFSYDYIDVAYISSNYSSDTDPAVLQGLVPNAPNGSIVDEMRGVDVEFKKSFGCNFYLAGEFYNTDGFLSDEIVQARRDLAGDDLLGGKRGEFYYYRLGVGARHSISDALDFTFEAGGLFADCRVPGKLQDEWGWYVAPGLRFCLGGFAEAYVTYFYEDYEQMANHRVDGGVIIPLPCSDCLSVKLGGRYESEYDKTSLLAGFRFNY